MKEFQEIEMIIYHLNGESNAFAIFAICHPSICFFCKCEGKIRKTESNVSKLNLFTVVVCSLDYGHEIEVNTHNIRSFLDKPRNAKRLLVDKDDNDNDDEGNIEEQ